MRIFLAGATGALGRRLVPLLIERGHSVIGTTRTPAKLESLRAAGIEGVVVDGLNRGAVREAVGSSRPDVIVHQMTAIGSMPSLKRFDEGFAATNRLRVEGTRYLLEAGVAAGVRRLVAQSFTGWPNIRQGGRVKTEGDPLDSRPAKAMSATLEAIRTLERLVTTAAGIDGVVLRYGYFYGPGTSMASDGEIAALARARRFPIVGSGAGVWSFIHVDDAARATCLAIEGSATGIFNVVDDDPAEVSVWLPEYARALGAKPPWRVPAWIGRLAVGEPGLVMMMTARGSSNQKVKAIFGWEPAYASWREGFRSLDR